jgi:ADP-ribose pyrophosphatase YjhB (NUDIX family)
VTQVLYGYRISKSGELRLGSCAVIFDKLQGKVLLTRRADYGLWCLPGGKMESGESIEECFLREVLEETCLEVRIRRLIGIYSNRDQLVVYPDGHKVQIAVLSFEAEIIGGKLGLSDETTAADYYSLLEMESMPMHGRHLERVKDAMLYLPTPIIN